MSCFGRLIPRHEEIFLKNPLYVGVKLPVVKSMEPLSIKFAGYAKDIVDIMQSCLYYAPEERTPCHDLVNHPYFGSFVEEFEREHAAAVQRDREENEVITTPSHDTHVQTQHGSGMCVSAVRVYSGFFSG
jgi:cyclin-dependent kinase-like